MRLSDDKVREIVNLAVVNFGHEMHPGLEDRCLERIRRTSASKSTVLSLVNKEMIRSTVDTNERAKQAMLHRERCRKPRPSKWQRIKRFFRF